MKTTPLRVPSKLTQEMMKVKFDYSEELGTLIHREVLGVYNSYVGKPAGYKCLSKEGYWLVKISNKVYRLHRIIWLWHYGTEPDMIDHIDRNKDNNSIENLRTTSNAIHAHNKDSIHSKNGKLRGTTLTIYGTYQAKICKDDIRYFLGTYTTEEEAHAAYCGAAIILFGPDACLV